MFVGSVGVCVSINSFSQNHLNPVSVLSGSNRGIIKNRYNADRWVVRIQSIAISNSIRGYGGGSESKPGARGFPELLPSKSTCSTTASNLTASTEDSASTAPASTTTECFCLEKTSSLHGSFRKRLTLCVFMLFLTVLWYFRIMLVSCLFHWRLLKKCRFCVKSKC